MVLPVTDLAPTIASFTSKADLQALSLSCSAFVYPAQAELFKHVSIPISGSPKEHQRLLEKLLSLVESLPRITGYIKGLAFQSYNREKPAAHSYLAKLLTLLELQELRLTIRGGNPLSSELVDALVQTFKKPSMRRLVLGGMEGLSRQEFAALLSSAYPHCIDLTIDNMSSACLLEAYPSLSTPSQHQLTPSSFGIFERDDWPLGLTCLRSESTYGRVNRIPGVGLSSIHTLYFRVTHLSHSMLQETVNELQESVRTEQLSPINITDRCFPPLSFHTKNLLISFSLDLSHTWFGVLGNTRAYHAFEREHGYAIPYASLTLATFDPTSNSTKHPVLSFGLSSFQGVEGEAGGKTGLPVALERLVDTLASTFPKLARPDFSVVGIVEVPFDGSRKSCRGF